MPDKFKFLNPVGIEEAIDLSALAPRLDKNNLDGKTIHLCITGEPDVTIYIDKQIRAAYPKVNWTMKRSYTPVPVRLSDEERKTTDAVVLAVSW